jgi:hypothetical protein
MSYSKLIFHIVIRTKNSVPCISEGKEDLLYKYIYGFLSARNLFYIELVECLTISIY